jgi:hypothetical protein
MTDMGEFRSSPMEQFLTAIALPYDFGNKCTRRRGPGPILWQVNMTGGKMKSTTYFLRRGHGTESKTARLMTSTQEHENENHEPKGRRRQRGYGESTIERKPSYLYHLL